MNKIKIPFKVELNSPENVQTLLQELYDEACKNLVDIEKQMTKLTNAVDLNTEIMDGKVKYAKAMNDFIANRDKALQKKLEIAKLMADIIKESNKTAEANAFGMDENFEWDNIRNAEDGNKTEEYHLK